MRATGQGLEDMNTEEFDALMAEMNEDPEADLMDEGPNGAAGNVKSQTLKEGDTASQAPRKLGSGSASSGKRRLIEQDDEDEDDEVDQLEDDEESFVPPTQAPRAAIRNGRVSCLKLSLPQAFQFYVHLTK